MKNFKIGDKLTRFPLIQGGMGVGISLGRLAGTVAKEGGIGIISTAQIGYREKDFDRNTEEANQRAILSEMKKARRISPDGIIGYNIMVALKEYASHVKAAIQAGADLIISGAGLPTELPALVSGSKTKIAPIVSTDKSAKVILKYWERKYRRTADLVVIEGPQAGGHLGFHKEELDSYTPEAYDNEIRKIVQTVKGYAAKFGTEIPVVAAGGIATHEDVKHVFDLGVDGVQVATRFIPTEECDADIRLKESLIHTTKDDIAIVKSPVGMPGRAIMNPFMQHVMAGEKIPHSPCHRCLAKCSPGEIPYCITDKLIAAVKGDVENGLLFCGAKAYMADKIETVHDVIADLFGTEPASDCHKDKPALSGALHKKPLLSLLFAVKTGTFCFSTGYRSFPGTCHALSGVSRQSPPIWFRLFRNCSRDQWKCRLSE